jgi:hypothetical protein
MKVNDILQWSQGVHSHQWRIRGIHLGGEGVESLIELENISHKPGWTGEWMTHQLMFVPECLLRDCKIIRPAPVGS